MKVPLIRIGITLAVGSVLANLVMFYVALGGAAGSVDEADPPSTLGGALDWFVQDFLFEGSVPTVLFWLGIGVAFVGIGRMALAPSGRSRQAN